MSIKPTIPDNPEIEVIKAGKTGLFTNYIFKAIPLAFDESMSYYETLCGLLNYLKNVVIPTVNNNADAVSELQTLYEELRTFVDDYFTNLDVQEEINNKLDDMAESGELGEILRPYFNSLTQQINELDGDLQNEKVVRQTTDSNLQNQINNIVAGAGTEGSSSAEILQARVNTNSQSFPTLNDRISFIEKTVPFKWKVLTNADLNDLTEAQKVVLITPSANSPFNTATAFLTVDVFPTTNAINTVNYPWIVQTLYVFPNNVKNGIATRVGQYINDNYRFYDWNVLRQPDIDSIINTLNGNVKRTNLSNSFASNGVISNDTDFNTLLNQGDYVVTVGNGANNPTGTSGILSVTSNDLGADSNNWVVQTYRTITSSIIYTRSIMFSNVDASTSIYHPWKKIYPFDDTNISLSGKKIVNFGDSIFGNFQGATSISQNIANITGATVYNVGFGGCQMSDRNDVGWKAFSMCNLATAVANQDFTMQDDAVNNTSWTSKPSYFDNHLNTLKNIDFSTVDIVTIAYGTNDYTAGDLLDNENNLKDINTFAGALRYSIETLLTAYPNLKIVIGTPLFRLWLNDGVIVYTSDTRKYAGNYTLIDMTNKVKDIGKEYHCQIIDAYNDFGVNQYNWQRIFNSTDTTHPNETGRALLGRLYGIELLK